MKLQKLLLPFEGKTILERVIEKVLFSKVEKILVVTGSGRDDILKLIDRLPVQHCFNKRYSEGMLSSVKCGFKSLPASCGAALVFLGDQPMISVKSIDDIIEGYTHSGKRIAVPTYGGKRGHPLLVDMKYRDKVNKMNEKEGLHSLLSQFSGDVLEVPVDDPGILRDIDTKDDYQNELNKNQ